MTLLRLHMPFEAHTFALNSGALALCLVPFEFSLSSFSSPFTFMR